MNETERRMILVTDDQMQNMLRFLEERVSPMSDALRVEVQRFKEALELAKLNSEELGT